MRNVVQLLIFLILFSCNPNITRAQGNERIIPEKDTLQGHLIGKSLDDIDDLEKELNFLFEFEVIEAIVVYNEEGGVKDSIYIEKIKNWNDPGDFHRIKIVSNENEYLFFNVDGWVEKVKYNQVYSVDFASSEVKNSKLINVQKASPNTYLIFAFGYPYASQPELLSVISVSKENIHLAFNENYYLTDFSDFNSDGFNDIKVSKRSAEDAKLHTKDIKRFFFKNGWFFADL
ncbi:hypothetical protein EYV94_18370 [Puteibacter caeruleilacunae]|nr:hypothetical protein EYV94_18370 [Puteibacter caeruleilacunae]